MKERKRRNHHNKMNKFICGGAVVCVCVRRFCVLEFILLPVGGMELESFVFLLLTHCEHSNSHLMCWNT